MKSTTRACIQRSIFALSLLGTAMLSIGTVPQTASAVVLPDQPPVQQTVRIGGVNYIVTLTLISQLPGNIPVGIDQQPTMSISASLYRADSGSTRDFTNPRISLNQGATTLDVPLTPIVQTAMNPPSYLWGATVRQPFTTGTFVRPTLRVRSNGRNYTIELPRTQVRVLSITQ